MDDHLFDTTYRNRTLWRLLRAYGAATHRLKSTDEDHAEYDVSARVWKPDDDELLMLRVWLPSDRCRHLVLDENGVVLAGGLERREGKSWEQTLTRLIAVGAVQAP